MPTPRLKMAMLGTGDFAVPTFRALYESPHEVVALLTQPDRTGAGRHQSHANTMKELAVERGTPVFQPADVNTPESLDRLRSLGSDVFVVAAYGQILSSALLSIPRLGAINVHASLLPKFRGAAPVACAILNGESETGVSIIQVVPRLDAGPILAVARTPIGPQETAGELENRLAILGAPLVQSVLNQLAAGTHHPIPQIDELATRARKLTKEMGAIDWSRPAQQIDRHVRGMQPWPMAYTWVHSAKKPPQRVIILAVSPAPATAPPADNPGAVVAADRHRLWIETGTGPLEIVRLQPDGKRPMIAADFLRGNRMSSGDHLGPVDEISP